MLKYLVCENVILSVDRCVKKDVVGRSGGAGRATGWTRHNGFKITGKNETRTDECMRRKRMSHASLAADRWGYVNVVHLETIQISQLGQSTK